MRTKGLSWLVHSPAANLALAALALLGLACPVAAGEQVPFHGGFAGVKPEERIRV